MDELNSAIEEYHKKWHEIVDKRHNKEFFKKLKPAAVGWKVEDLAEFDRRFADMRNECDQIHLGSVNGRWIATMHLKDATLACGVNIVKLMQRRPQSTDPVGLDHVDFHIPEKADAKAVLTTEPDLKWTEEKNGDHCKWISIWFAGKEAKLRSDTVLQVCIDELNEIQAALTKD